MKRLLFLAACSFFTSFSVVAQRLPDTVVPDSYDLRFEPDLSSATFIGDVTIHVRLQKATNSVVLNSAELEFQQASIASGDFKQAAAFKTDDKSETATISVPSMVPAGPAEIHVHFKGILSDKLRGFYLSQTARRRYAVTQFEATDARRAFPCFDEPAYKAVFRISLVIDEGDTAISNGEIASDAPGPSAGKHTVQFSESPKMSTYLVAVMVGDFSCVQGAAESVPIRVCAVPEKKDFLSFALLAAENNLKFFGTYFTTKYPFRKLDIVAIPDFSGAMENTAAIISGESFVVVDEKSASVEARQATASVLAHEMAHMWFGDLVTMKWWDDIWLNEGFATWMSFKPGEAWKQDWHSERSEVAQTVGALTTDSLSSIRPIRAKAETPAEIATLFDGIAYDKAASVLRMVEAYVGPEVFQKGVNAYLGRRAYANASAEDFWNQIAATSQKPVDGIMTGFTQQPGAPLVTVKVACATKTEKKGKLPLPRKKETQSAQVTLSQERYFADAEKLGAGSQEIWQIPVSLRAAGSSAAAYSLLAQREQTVELPGCPQWVYANAGGRGYYITAYDSATIGKMSSDLENAFSPEERIHFLGDEWAQVRVGRLSVADYLDTLEKLKAERTRAVVDVMMNHFQQIHDTIVSRTDRPEFQRWVRDFLRPVATELGDSAASGESDEKRVLRGDVFWNLASFGRDPQLLEKSRAIVDQYMRDPVSLDATLAGNAVEVSARVGNSDLYDKFMQHLKTAKTPEEYYNYFFALQLFPDPDLAKRTFDFLLSPDVKSQDIAFIASALRVPDTQAAAWELFKANYDALIAKGGSDLGGRLVNFAGMFCDEKLRDDSQDFFASKNIPGSERPLQNAKDQVNACIQVRSLQQANLSAYLKKGAATAANQ